MIKILERAIIKTIPIEFDFSQNKDNKVKYGKSDKSDTDIDINTEQTGRFPMIFINSVQIEYDDIIYFKIGNDAVLPYLEVTMRDPTNKLYDENYPKDNTIISIYKKSANSVYMDIKMDFKILLFKIIKGKTSDDKKIKIYSILNINDLYLKKSESYKGTSFDILKKISSELELGFATNISNTNDSMTWINPKNQKINFIINIINKSYLSDNTFIFGYIDFYYNFNYVDIENQLDEDISSQNNILDNEQTIKTKTKEVPLILTNHPDKNKTNLFINKYTIDNNSTKINLEYGYRTKVIDYDKENYNINSYLLDSISYEGNDNIVLKDNNDNYLYNNHIVTEYLGKYDLDNVHENYLHSMVQNKKNLKFVQKLKLVIKLLKPNYGLYRFQKVLVELYNLSKLDNNINKDDNNKDVDNANKQYDKAINNKLSGEWLITSINFIYDNNDSNYQEITLVKRELSEKYTFPRRTKNKKK